MKVSNLLKVVDLECLKMSVKDKAMHNPDNLL